MEAEKWFLSVLVERTAMCLCPLPRASSHAEGILLISEKNLCDKWGYVRFCVVGHKCCLRDILDVVELLGMYYSLQSNFEFWHHSAVAAFTQ